VISYPSETYITDILRGRKALVKKRPIGWGAQVYEEFTGGRVSELDSNRRKTPDKVGLSIDSDTSDVPVDLAPALADVLEQVVSATNTGNDSPSRDVALRRRLEQVAARLGDQVLTVDPVLVSLLDAVNDRIRFLTPQEKLAMNQTVAKTLYDDSESRVRLERLWHSLRNRTPQ
jgi:hypothetical protein